MPKKRIPEKPTELRDLMYHISSGINANPGWPANAPTANDYLVLGTTLNNKIIAVQTLESQLATARGELRDEAELAKKAAVKADEASSLQHGADSPKKLDYGIPPKKSATTPVPLDQCLITKITDGRHPASLFVDWDNEEGAASYEVEWFLDANLTQKIGHTAVGNSELQITGLTPGTQYWVHVRAIRGAEKGLWSDPATRIANK